MKKRDLILSMPVIHQGYLDFFDKQLERIEKIYVLSPTLVEKFSELKPDIANIPFERLCPLLSSLGYPSIGLFDEQDASRLASRPLLFVNDQVSRSLAQKLFQDSDVEWESVFLRWDETLIYSEEDPATKASTSSEDVEHMKMAQQEARKSSDWWRQVGAVAVKDGRVVYVAHNEGMPSDHSPYQVGAIRDLLKPGERPEMVDTIHAEQKIVAMAAREGHSLKGAVLYVTHFPCPVCAKLIVHSGFASCRFSKGYSSLKGVELLHMAGVDVAKVVS